MTVWQLTTIESEQQQKSHSECSGDCSKARRESQFGRGDCQCPAAVLPCRQSWCWQKGIKLQLKSSASLPRGFRKRRLGQLGALEDDGGTPEIREAEEEMSKSAYTLCPRPWQTLNHTCRVTTRAAKLSFYVLSLNKLIAF